MTQTELRCLNLIRDYTAEHGHPPSYTEMADGLELHSKSGVARLVTSLERQGKIRRTPHRERSIEIVAPSYAGMADAIVKALLEDHEVLEDDEHPDALIVCSAEEARVTISRVLGQ